jgi:Ca-activated chloride channel family protein
MRCLSVPPRTPSRAPAALLTALTCSLSLAPTLHAQGWIEIERRPGPMQQLGAVTRVGSNVRITVEGRVARVEVEERFRNTGGVVAEGSYLYPLAGEAVFTGFSLWQGDKELRGETMNAEQARGIYEEIVRRRKDPALLTLAGHGLIRAQVFPIEPGDTRRVVLRYTQLLTREGDALRLRYALGARGGEAAGDLHVRLADPNSFGNPYSPTHTLDTQRSGDRVEVAVSGRTGGDLELFLPLRRALAGASVVTHAPGGEDGYFMLLLAPPPAEREVAVPRDLTLVVDVSGSMSGTKLEQAKAALQQALGTLRPADRFRLIAFSSAVRAFRPQPVPATRENLADARGFVDRLAAEGGTNIAAALDTALAGPSDTERLSLVVFVTDGLPSIGEQSPERIAEAAAARAGRTRIFPVGLGQDVNTYLLDRLAAEGHGSAEYVAPETSVESAVGGLLAKLRYPALVDLRVAEAPVRLSLLAPQRLPDLFYGEELVVFGRYQGTGRGAVVITGERNGTRERIVTDATFPGTEPANDFIPRLWASRRIGELTRQIRLEGPNSGLVEEVRTLGLRYGVVTEYTSYLVQEPNALASAPPPIPMEREDARAQTGAAAFDRARASSKLAEVKTLNAAEEVAQRRMEAVAKDRASGALVRRVGGRVFVQRGEVWTDLAQSDRIPVTVVAEFSRAYFDLVRMLPELAPCLAVGDQVLVAGRQASIRIAPSGIQELNRGQLNALVGHFRGT